MQWSEESLRDALKEVKLPAQKQNIFVSGLFQGFEQREKSLLIQIRLPAREATFEKSLNYQIKKALQAKDPSLEIAVVFSAEESQSSPAQGAPTQKSQRPRIGSILLIGSGKGGVGKSAITVNLAAALKKKSYRVGILDCDLYGPSIPTMMGVEGQKPFILDGKIQPIDAHGMKIMSAGFFLEEGQGLVWRGPMIHKLIQQFYQDVAWDGTDVLLIDLPPGTGDAPLSISQSFPINGALLVSLPQKISLIDVHKAYAMFQQVKIPVFGLVENMSEFICPHCEKSSEIFPKGGVKDFAKKIQTPFLGSIPIEPRLRDASDRGIPFVIEHPEHPVSRAFLDLAERIQPMLRTSEEAHEEAVSFVL
jgi:ATP-binding protein involved in chromosome partitioning